MAWADIGLSRCEERDERVRLLYEMNFSCLIRQIRAIRGQTSSSSITDCLGYGTFGNS